MQVFDLAIAYKWVYDKELVDDIERYFHRNNLTTFVIHKAIIHQTLNKVQRGEILFRNFLDRATDEDEDFEPLAEAIIQSGAKTVNLHHLIDDAIDKATLLPKLNSQNIDLPETIILPPFEEEPELSISDEELNRLGKPFIIKPAYYSGGGEGANVNGFTFEDIQTLRRELYDDRYLIQRKIKSKYFDSFKAWFRSFYLFGKVLTVQWDDETRIYDDLPFRKMEKIDYKKIEEITKKIADICKLHYFSTEVTIGTDGKYYAIDFVNDPCDFRRKSIHKDGVPDVIVDKFIEELKRFVKS